MDSQHQDQDQDLGVSNLNLNLSQSETTLLERFSNGADDNLTTWQEVGWSSTPLVWSTDTTSSSSSSSSSSFTTSTASNASFYADEHYWQKLVASFIVDLVRILTFLHDHFDRLLMYFIISITSSMILILLGITVKIVISRSSRDWRKAPVRQPSGAAVRSYRRQASHNVNLTEDGNDFTVSSSACGRASSWTSRAPEHGTPRRCGNKSQVGFDRVRNQQYVYSCAHERRTPSSPPQTLLSAHRARAACETLTFSESVGDGASCSFSHDSMPSFNFQVVRFQPQRLAGKCASSATSAAAANASFHDEDFDFDE